DVFGRGTRGRVRLLPRAGDHPLSLRQARVPLRLRRRWSRREDPSGEWPGNLGYSHPEDLRGGRKVASLLFVGTHATDDPTKAALPFLCATGALANKIDVAVALLAEAPYLMKDEIAK